MKKTIISILFIVLLIRVEAYPQLLDTLSIQKKDSSANSKVDTVQTDLAENKDRSKGIGFIFGFTTGFGVCYRYYPGDMGYFASANFKKEGDKKLLNIGMGILKEFSKTKAVSLYWVGELGYYHKENEWLYNLDKNDDGNIGVGFGIDFPRRMENEIPIQFSLKALYTYFIKQENFLLKPGAMLFVTF